MPSVGVGGEPPAALGAALIKGSPEGMWPPQSTELPRRGATESPLEHRAAQVFAAAKPPRQS